MALSVDSILNVLLDFDNKEYDLNEIKVVSIFGVFLFVLYFPPSRSLVNVSARSTSSYVYLQFRILKTTSGDFHLLYSGLV